MSELGLVGLKDYGIKRKNPGILKIKIRIKRLKRRKCLD